MCIYIYIYTSYCQLGVLVDLWIFFIEQYLFPRLPALALHVLSIILSIRWGQRCITSVLHALSQYSNKSILKSFTRNSLPCSIDSSHGRCSLLQCKSNAKYKRTTELCRAPVVPSNFAILYYYGRSSDQQWSNVAAHPSAVVDSRLHAKPSTIRAKPVEAAVGGCRGDNIVRCRGEN